MNDTGECNASTGTMQLECPALLTAAWHRVQGIHLCVVQRPDKVIKYVSK